MSETITPMMRQYRRVKSEIPEGTLLLFRLGDFYELFYEDAKDAAPIIDVALTKRNEVPMCGVPYHALDSYLSKLIKAGRKAAICEQVEDASEAKGIVRREVTRVVTPGTVIEDAILESKKNNFLAGIYPKGTTFGLALLDLSTGLFQGERLEGINALLDSLRRCSPSECVIPEGAAADGQLNSVLSAVPGMRPAKCDGWVFDHDVARDNLARHFGVKSLDGFGCEGMADIIGAAGAILHYVKEQLHNNLAHIRTFRVRSSADFLVLDEATCLNLALVLGRGTDAATTLLGVLDSTKTAMGGRELRDWVLRPLCRLEDIKARHDAVGYLSANRSLLKDLREALSGVRDLERAMARVGAGSGNARDIKSVGLSLQCVPEMKKLLGTAKADVFSALAASLQALPEIVTLVDKAIVDEPPAVLRDGGIIRDGYSPELDELRGTASTGRNWLAEYQTKEQARTGIKTLKVRHNKVFGYYIEVSRGQVSNVPPEYTRKQTLVNGERYITPELKEYESKILGAQEKAIALENELFQKVRSSVMEKAGEIQATAAAIGKLDALASLADRAVAFRYVRPVMTAGRALRIKDGRHPVIEQIPDAERFVPNDTLLDCDQNQLAIITGPNMAGKSTYIRQVALIVIMAHVGSFVPASEAEIGIVDRVFTRVGASDDLARGRSTFMVEMQETANILNNATDKSLIVLDEIGRGTSTFDGISIAWAVAEYLHNNSSVKAKTLFATHYHELTDLAKTMTGVKNYNVVVREQNDTVVFIRKIVAGASDKSYGIQVARLAGMPAEVVERANEILANLEEGEIGESGQPNLAKKRQRKDKTDSSQMSLF